MPIIEAMQRRAAQVAQQAQVGLEPGQQQQQHHAQGARPPPAGGTAPASGGKSAAKTPGAKCPSTLGPSTMPAASSPTTAGSAMRRHSSAPSRATSSSSASLDQQQEDGVPRDGRDGRQHVRGQLIMYGPQQGRGPWIAVGAVACPVAYLAAAQALGSR